MQQPISAQVMHLTKQQFGEIKGLSGAPVYGAYVNDLKKERKNFQ